MRNAAHRRDSEVPPEPPSRDHLVADAVAGAAAWAERRNALIARLEAEPGNHRLIDELVIANIRTAENTAALEDCTAGESVVEAVDRAAFARGWDARGAAGQQSSRPRHAGGRGHLRLAGGAAVKATAVAAAAAAATATTMIAAHDSASVHRWSAASPAAVRLHEVPPDSAVPFPVRSPSPRPSAAAAAAAASARPVPPPAPSPSGSAASSPPAPSVSPPPSPVQAPSPSLLVSARDLDLSGTSGTFTITAQDGTVDWWVSTDIPGASVDVRQGVLSPGQEPVTITVTDPQGESGFVYVKWDGGGIASVWVTPSAGVPALALS